MPPSDTSNSSADPEGLPPGTVVAGFRVDRRIGGDELGAVYEATQLSLERAVALRVLSREAASDPDLASRLEAQLRLRASVHHPNLVPIYEAGEWEGGWFVAGRLIRGRTLVAELAGKPSPQRLAKVLDGAAGGLAAAHEAGLVHGDVSAANVLVDKSGNAYLADLGLARSGTVEGDREAFALIRAEAEAGARRARRLRLRVGSLAGAAGLGAIALAAVLAFGDGGEGPSDIGAEPPRPVDGTTPLGSALAAGPSTPMGCSTDPGLNTPACVLGQRATDAGPSVVERSGVIRSWAVRGASGDVSLQVIGRRGRGTFLSGFSQVETITDRGPHSFETSVPVEKGDRIAVQLAPGAEIATREQGGASMLRWEGALPFAPAPQSSAVLPGELLVRADIEPGAEPELQQVAGAEAARAPAGEVVGEQIVDAPGISKGRIELIRVGSAMAVDSFRGNQRLARLTIPDLDPAGEVLAFEGYCGFRHGFCLRWLNESDDQPVIHAYRLEREGRFELIG